MPKSAPGFRNPPRRSRGDRLRGKPDVSFPSGYRIGHATDSRRLTGCTVVLPPPGTIAAVDVRGGAPGTRETGVFTPGNLVSEIHGLLFAGGSAFGLAAADGVMEWLRAEGRGVEVGRARVPIVAGAILFDLAVGDPLAYPDAVMGREACLCAAEGGVPRGAVGAGTGATIGKLLGIERASRGGIGVASLPLPEGGEVAALVAVNAFGDVVDPANGRVVAGPRRPGAPFVSEQALLADAPIDGPLGGGANTTLVCVATTVPFEPGSLKRVAMEAHDGVARAVRPAHTLVDGDVVFALSPGGASPSVLVRLRVGTAAAEAVARAILDAAESAGRPASGSSP